MKLSARNVLKGTVDDIKKGQVMAIVKLRLGSGTVLSSIITNESVDRLELKPGKAAFAVIKASSVMVASGDFTGKLSARNVLKGIVNKLNKGMVMASVEIDIGNGDIVTATISDESAENLGLKTGGEALAVVKATSVMMGAD
jgi:molybdate transport system regulatory protein